jgi:hypothetical protein
MATMLRDGVDSSGRLLVFDHGGVSRTRGEG